MRTRTRTQLRPLSAQHGLLARADGSAAFAFGTLTAYASSTGPLEARLRDELIDRAALHVHLTPLVGLPGVAARGFAQRVRELLEGVVLLHLHPRAVVQVNVQLVSGPPVFSPPPRTSLTPDAILIGDEDDDGEEEEEEEQGEGGGDDARIGPPPRKLRPPPPHANSTFTVSERATMINAAMLALLDSGIAMQATVAACACAYLPTRHADRLRKRRRRRPTATTATMTMTGTVKEEEDDSLEIDAASVLVLDPTPEEEHYATSTHVFAFGLAGQAPPPLSSLSSSAGEGEGAYELYKDDDDEEEEERDADEEEEMLFAESHGPLDLERYTAAAQLCRRAARQLIVPFYRRWLLQQHARQ